MHDLRVKAGSLRTQLQLQHAAGIGSDDEFRLGRAHGFHLGVENLLGYVGVRDVIDAGAATAALGITHFDEPQAGNGPQEFARLRADSLAMRQMARVLVGRPFVDGVCRRRDAARGQELAHIAHFVCKGLRTLTPFRVSL